MLPGVGNQEIRSEPSDSLSIYSVCLGELDQVGLPGVAVLISITDPLGQLLFRLLWPLWALVQPEAPLLSA
jgi:hypothetical protein